MKKLTTISLLFLFAWNSTGVCKYEDPLLEDAVGEISEGKTPCRCNGFELKGRVKIVDSFPDIKIKIVESFADIHVQTVGSFPDECGKWQFVESFPDFTVQIVKSFPDLTVKFVDSFPGMQ